jgi:hypothetical protein
MLAGFVTNLGEAGEIRRFSVSTEPKPLTDQPQFRRRLGLITAAYYDEAPQLRAGLRRQNGPGVLRAVVHIRYLEAEEPEAPADRP